MKFAWYYLKLRIRRYKAGLTMLVIVPALLFCTMIYSYIDATNESLLHIAKKSGDPSKLADVPALVEQALRDSLPVGMGIFMLFLLLGHIVFRIFEPPASLTSESEKFLSALPLSRFQLNACGLIDSLTAFKTILAFALALIPAYLLFSGGGLYGLFFFAFPAYLACEAIIWAVAAILQRVSSMLREFVAIALCTYLGALLFVLLAEDKSNGINSWLGRKVFASEFLALAYVFGEGMSGRHQGWMLYWNACAYAVFFLCSFLAVLLMKPKELGWTSEAPGRHGILAMLLWIDERLLRPVRGKLKMPFIVLLGTAIFAVAFSFEAYWAMSELKASEAMLLSPMVALAAVVCGAISRGTFSHFAFQRNLPISTFRIVLESILPGIKVMLFAFVFKLVVFLMVVIWNGFPFWPAIGHCVYLLFWIPPFCLLCSAVGLLANLLCEKSWQNRRFKSNLIVVLLILMQEMFFVSANLCFAFWLNEMPFVGLLALYIVAPLYFFHATVLFDRIDLVRFTRRPALEARN